MTETSAVTPSFTLPPPPTSVEANIDASEISVNSTQKTSTATPSAVPPPPTSIEAHVDAPEQSGNSTQKLPGQYLSNAEMAVDTAETFTATPSAAPLLHV
jgi:hypothetical protein